MYTIGLNKQIVVWGIGRIFSRGEFDTNTHCDVWSMPRVVSSDMVSLTERQPVGYLAYTSCASILI